MEATAASPLQPWVTGSDLAGYRVDVADPAALLVVVHGFGEHAARHARMMQRLAERRIASYAYDHRGHGHSPGERAFIERFDDLVSDAGVIRRRAAAEHPGLPLFVFGMSMGGVVAARSVERSADGVRGLVLISPAFAAAEHIPKPVQTVLRFVRRFAPRMQLAKLKTADLSLDPAIGDAYAADPLTYHGGVPLASGIELVAAGDAAIADARALTLPILLLQGDGDRIVFPIGAKRFGDAVATTDLTYTVVPGGYHELLNDPGGERAVESIGDWMLARA